MNDRIGDWIQSYSGRQWFPLDPRPEDFSLEDIAHSLAIINRYAGHTREPLSVAQHSVMASQIIAPECAAWGLFHDAAETVIGDMARPWKRMLAVKRPSPHYNDYWTVKHVEHKILDAIGERFGLPPLTPAIEQEIERADITLLATERRDLMNPSAHRWHESIEKATPMATRIHPVSWRDAKTLFLWRAEQLANQGECRW